MGNREKLKAAVGQPRLRNALDQIQSELDALEEGDLQPINIEPLTAIATARGALPKILLLREEILSSLPKFEAKHLDNLELYSLALMQAHALFLAAKGRLKDRKELAAEAYQLRSRLLSDVTTLKQRGLLPLVNLRELKGPNGHLNIACDVMSLANLLRSHWNVISNQCAVTIEELDRAEILSDDLTQAVGVRDRVPEALIQAAKQRVRAYTLFIKAYTASRNAVIYIRSSKRDHERIAPSLFHGRKSTKKTAVESETNTAEVVPPGLPNSDPFLH
jgi:hypothetical protein